MRPGTTWMRRVQDPGTRTPKDKFHGMSRNRFRIWSTGLNISSNRAGLRPEPPSQSLPEPGWAGKRPKRHDFRHPPAEKNSNHFDCIGRQLNSLVIVLGPYRPQNGQTNQIRETKRGGIRGKDAPHQTSIQLHVFAPPVSSKQIRETIKGT